ncbi:AMP-binding protein [Lentzea sp. DG1S-22]|uniref:AMP-binding protein n=1 Tax=Lentzea sp. DG1S-22 TaxID=3108822 RepID=UPI002E7A17D9|nr:AMP-binding protein [Lentzea sp. DG1S-22]WVH82079.1 AMP-binding protein [Lentzea sp. DG1S-22]
MPLAGRSTLVHVLLDHVADHGDQRAYEYLHDDGRVEEITYRELFARARTAAHRLRAENTGGGPALLLYPPGLDFVVAVWACFLAGVPAVPAYPPLFGPADRITRRFARVLADSRATVLMADPVVLGVLKAFPDLPPLPPVVPLDGPEITDDLALPAPGDVALVQYTSGSTNQPKGVVLEHGNLIANVRAISEVFTLDDDTNVVSWLPPYHDMGLIGFILTPVHGRFPVRLMSPVHFLRNPLDWLRQVSELRATHTGGPNFAYDLCVRRARTADLSDVDLSSWRLAFNGAEPIRPRTLTAFAERFAAHGFRESAFLPCYGLAEATLIVTGHHWSPSSGVDAHNRVDCGPVIAGHELAVVSPDATRVREGEEGELWLRGPSISRGYWNDTGQTEDELFGELDGNRYLRTGDLGYLRDGHLFVTGRSKDVVIQNGVNHHAHDLEAAAVDDEPALRPTAAAFSVEGDHEEVVLVVETATRDVDAEAVAARVRERVLAATGARVDTVVLCPPRAIPRTTSGKVQRNLTRTRYVAGELNGRLVGRTGTSAVAESDTVEQFLASVFAAVCEVPECPPTQQLSAIGGDSIRAAEIAAVTEEALTLPVPVDAVLSTQSPRALTAHLLAVWAQEGITGAKVVDRIGALSADGPASRP